MISILVARSFIAVKTSGSSSKSNCAANRAARIIRNGSSVNESPALPGVRSVFAAKS